MAVDTTAVLAAFRVVAPEFSAEDPSDLISLLAGAITPSVFGGRTSEAVARLAAHELTLQARAAASSAGATGVGPVTSLSAGDLSVAFGGLSSSAMSHEDDYYRQTPHGLAYLQIRDSRAQVGFGLLT